MEHKNARAKRWSRHGLQAKTMSLDELAKMIMNRFSIIENYLICKDKQWTNFSIGIPGARKEKLRR